MFLEFKEGSTLRETPLSDDSGERAKGHKGLNGEKTDVFCLAKVPRKLPTDTPT